MALSDAVWSLILATVPWLAPAVAVAYLAGLGAHGASLPTRPFWAVIGLMVGFAMGIPLPWVLGMTDGSTPARMGVAVLLVTVALTGVLLALGFTGRLRAAGLILAGSALPTVVYMGAALIDMLAAYGTTTLTLGATVATAAVAILVGVALAIHGDAKPMPDPAAKAGRPGSHRGGSLSAALTRKATYGLVPPTGVLPFAGAVIGSMVAAGEPIQTMVACLAGAALGGWASMEIELRWIPRRPRLALEGLAWTGLRDIERFREVTGGQVPITPKTMDAWLATPGSDADARFRVELMAWRGRIQEARALAAQLPSGTPTEAFQREVARVQVEWRAGARPDLGELRRLAAVIEPPDSDERRMAEGELASTESEHRLGNLDPAWIEPLLAFRGTLPASVAGLHGRAMRQKARFTAVATAVAASVAVGIMSIRA